MPMAGSRCGSAPPRGHRPGPSRFGRTAKASLIATKSPIGGPSMAVMRSPTCKPACSAGPAGNTRPICAGTGCDQKRMPTPRISAEGSVNARRSAGSSTRSSSSRSAPLAERTASRVTPSPDMASMRPSTTSPRPCTSAPSSRMISSSARSPARAAGEPAATPPTTARTSGEPTIQSIPQSSRMAKAKLKPGPASSTRMRCQGGRRVKARETSAASTGPSRSSSSLT